jgi:hypothetical protein
MKFRPWLAINVALKLTNGHFQHANSLPACFSCHRSADRKTIEHSDKSGARKLGMAPIHAISQSIARRNDMAQDQERTRQRGGTKETNPGNFANDRERASRAGHKGGQASGGNFANDRQRASEAGRKGGRNSHGAGRSQ